MQQSSIPASTPSTKPARFLGLEFLDTNIARFDLHGRVSDVQLDTDQPIHLAGGFVVVDDLAHHAPIDELDDRIAAGDDVYIVPVFIFDQVLELGAIAERAHVSGPLACSDVVELAS